MDEFIKQYRFAELDILKTGYFLTTYFNYFHCFHTNIKKKTENKAFQIKFILKNYLKTQ